MCVVLVLQFLKLEDVGDHIRIEEWHIQYRGSLMAQLLHYTIDHSKEEARNEGGEEMEDIGDKIDDLNVSQNVVDL